MGGGGQRKQGGRYVWTAEKAYELEEACKGRMLEHVLSFQLPLRGPAQAHTEGMRRQRMSVRRIDLGQRGVC